MSLPDPDVYSAFVSHDDEDGDEDDDVHDEEGEMKNAQKQEQKWVKGDFMIISFFG